MGRGEQLLSLATMLENTLAISKAPGWESTVARFQANFEHFVEVGIHEAGPSVSALTLGDTAAFFELVLDQMNEVGLPVEDQLLAATVRNNLDSWCLFRMDILSSMPTKTGLYFRQARSLEHSLKAASNLIPEAKERVSHFANLIQAEQVDIFSVEFQKHRSPRFKFYMRPGTNCRIGEELQTLWGGESEELRQLLCLSHEDPNSDMKPLLSLDLDADGANAKVKATLFQTNVQKAQQWIPEHRRESSSQFTPLHTAEILQKQAIEHIGLQHGPTGMQVSTNYTFP